MFKRESTCSICEKIIQPNEEIYAKMNYPKRAIMAEVKAYLNKNSKILCKNCYKKSKS